MLSNNQYSINNDDAETPLLGVAQQQDDQGDEKKTVVDKLKGVTGTAVFQTIVSVVIAIVIIIGMVGLVIGASLRENLVSYNIYDIVKVDNIKDHLVKLNTIATEHNGNRDVADGGFNASVDYVVSLLSRYSSVFDVTVQNFTSTVLELEEKPVLNVITPEPLAFVHLTDFSFHPSFEGDVESEVVYARNGCKADLYTPSTIAIISDDGCSVDKKITQASK